MTRAEDILGMVRAQTYDPFGWTPIVSDSHGHRATFYVMPDALRIDGIRHMVSARLQQQIADTMGGHLLTAKLADMMHWDAAVVIEPCIQTQPAPPGAPVMDSDEAELRHSTEVDEKIAGRTGLASTVGKDWILSRLCTPTQACNYGWISHMGPYESHAGVRCYQPVSTRHNLEHYDYSQVCRLVRGDCLLDGNTVLTASIMTSYEWCGLLSWDGIVPPRLPGVALVT